MYCATGAVTKPVSEAPRAARSRIIVDDTSGVAASSSTMRVGAPWPVGRLAGVVMRSASAGIRGGQNLIGIKDPVVDALVDLVIAAPDRQSLITRVRALDRVLLWGHYVVPNWHSNKYRVVYWNKLAHPEKTPPYALVLDSWWIDPAKDAALAGKQTAQ